MASLTPSEITQDPALATARVVESAVGLARAEAALMLAHARSLLIKTVGALLGVMLATSAAQVALMLFAFSPLAFEGGSQRALLTAIVLAIGLCGLGTAVAFSAWRGLQKGPGSATP
jgi:hypothetical protein